MCLRALKSRATTMANAGRDVYEGRIWLAGRRGGLENCKPVIGGGMHGESAWADFQ
jgi:hypothetical protein